VDYAAVADMGAAASFTGMDGFFFMESGADNCGVLRAG
jgi:hypothetical protein